MVEQSRPTLRLFDRAKGLCCLLSLLFLAHLSAPLAAAPLPEEQGDTDLLSLGIPELHLAPIAPVEEYQPQELRLAQMEDPELILELQGEETLAELQENEFEEEALSMAKALTLSLIPGGGWGLIYTGKTAQSLIPFLISAVGYGVGLVYMSGLFDESSEEVCFHKPSSEVVGKGECSLFEPTLQRPMQHTQLDPRGPLDANGQPTQPYFATKDDYELQSRGQDYDGFGLGLTIVVSTYAASSLLGALWSMSEVSEHNGKLRRRIESTAMAPRVTPSMLPSVTGRGMLPGFGLHLRF